MNLIGDFGGGGLYLAFGVVCALIECQRSGRGQVVDAAMVDGAATLMSSIYGMFGAGLHGPERSPLLDIGDPRDLEIVVDVLSTDAVEIRPGAEVTIVHWGGQGTLSGRVRRVEPAAFTKISTLGVEEQRVNVLVDITSSAEKWARLGDAYQVDAQIVVFTQDDATIVPAGALFRRGDQWNLYVVKEGRAEIRRVQVLRRSGRLAAIASGLTLQLLFCFEVSALSGSLVSPAPE